MRKVELLSPAKDLAIGKAAINNGADAVYIGAPAFGARKSAANSIEDIAELVKYAHRFYCRVFVTLNTILYDQELADAERMIHRLYEVGVDALIVQDLGILRMNLPPICLHASTQMHNYDLERIKFMDRMGFQRIVLARELSIEQIRRIRSEVKAELEVFIHGALCVSLSGQCYLSQYVSGRSANRGECAQPCRMKWSVKDAKGKVLINDKYILSLKDLNLTSYIETLIDSGVDSFKIEGRLKDENYVANITNHYSSLIDKHPDIQRIGSGRVVSAFSADPERSFNRGYTSYFAESRQMGMVNQNTPKSMGKYIGKVIAVKNNRIAIDAQDETHNGDGLCYLDKGELKGIKVNSTDGKWAVCNEIVKVAPGVELYRNYDHRFVMQLERSKSMRKIGVTMEVAVKDGEYISLKATDEDGNTVTHESEEKYERASNPVQRERLIQQLGKCGETDFICQDIRYLSEEVLFVPAAAANTLRRELLNKLIEVRELKREKLLPGREDKAVIYPGKPDWRLNVVNNKAREFYQDHGLTSLETGFEKRTGSSRERDLMHTRYCILHELGRCRKINKNVDLQFPLYLCNVKQNFRLEFDCQICFMRIIENC